MRVTVECEPPPPPPPPVVEERRGNAFAGLIAVFMAIALILLLVWAAQRPGPQPAPHHVVIPSGGALTGGVQRFAPPARRRPDPFARLVDAARRGDPNAQVSLGEAYRYGASPLPYNPILALEWFELAARQNHPGALRHMGEMVLAGEGAVPDSSLGITLLFRAANAGSVQARRMLHRIGY